MSTVHFQSVCHCHDRHLKRVKFAIFGRQIPTMHIFMTARGVRHQTLHVAVVALKSVHSYVMSPTFLCCECDVSFVIGEKHFDENNTDSHTKVTGSVLVLVYES